MTRSWIEALAAVAASVGLAACGGPGTTPTTEAANASRTVGEEYLIGPGDVLDVFVYRAPELSANGLPVRPDGRLSLPLVADIQATGRTPSGLSREIEGRLKQYVREPNVTVMVRGFVGPADQQIRVIGEATRPLALPYREGMTVLDVMIASGGLTRYASGNRARIERREAGGRPQSIPVRLADLTRDGDVSQDVPMRPGDTLIIPQGWF